MITLMKRTTPTRKEEDMARTITLTPEQSARYERSPADAFQLEEMLLETCLGAADTEPVVVYLDTGAVLFSLYHDTAGGTC
jgi:hypothetical protein